MRPGLPSGERPRAPAFGALAAVLLLAVFADAKTEDAPNGSVAASTPNAPRASASATPPLSPAERELPDVGDALGRVLAEPRYVFCHDEKRPLRGDGHLCRFAGPLGRAPKPRDAKENPSASATRCPAFEKACAQVEPEEHERGRFHLPAWLASFTESLFWGILAVGAGYFIYQIGRHFQKGRAPEETPDVLKKATKGGLNEDSVPASLGIVDKDAARLLASARTALLAGDPRTAARLGHAALVRALESGGYVHVDKSATNGDYARALAERPELRDVFSAAAREMEQSEFGQRVSTAEKLSQMLSRIEPIVQRLVTVALALGMALSVCACGPLEGSADGPGGTSVLRRLLEERGATFERRTRPLQNLSEDEVDTVILLSSASLDEEAWTALRAWTEEGGFLVMAGVPPEVPGAFGIKGHDSKPCADHPVVALEGPLHDAELTSHFWPVDLDDAWTRNVACAEGAVIATRDFGDGRLLVLSDPDFLTNASFSRELHARVFFTLVGAPGSVVLVDRLIGAGAASPYRAIANSGLGPLLAHGLAWLVLWALATGTGFGTRRDPVAIPRRAFSEHVRAMGLLYARAGAARYALAAYSAWALDRLTTRLRVGERGRVLDLGSAIARMTGRPEGSVARILAEAVDARERPDVPSMRGNETEDLATLAALDDIVRQTRGYR
jgi:hypothetical protein